MSDVMDSRVIVLSEQSGLFFVGPDAPEPWLADSRQAMRFASGSQAWRYAKGLEQSQSEFLEGHPVELETYDTVSRDTARVVSSADPYPVLKARWRRAFGEPLPLDYSVRPGHPGRHSRALVRLSERHGLARRSCARW